MLYQWEFRAYQRRFKHALQTSHGSWSLREGMLLRLVDEVGNISWGEIAPLPWFGSETLEQALEFCHQLPALLTNERIFSISDTLPACQFGFEAAWEGMRESAIDNKTPDQLGNVPKQATFTIENSTLQAQNSDFRALRSNIAAPNSTLRPQSSDVAVQTSELGTRNSNVAVQTSELQPQPSKFELDPTPYSPLPTPHSPALPQSALLPAGEAALNSWKALWEQDFRTFKWKIGVQAIAAELELLHSLTQSLPATANLRLDANGGLSLDDAAQWLETCDAITANPNLPVAMEYLEQPLAVSQFQAMQHLSDRYTTPIALDESVATLQQLQTCYENGWRGIFVIKPAIVGSPTRLRQFCQDYAIDAVFSSALETAIGRHMGLRLAKELGNPERAMGYGTAHWFNDVETSDFEQLWQTL